MDKSVCFDVTEVEELMIHKEIFNERIKDLYQYAKVELPNLDVPHYKKSGYRRDRIRTFDIGDDIIDSIEVRNIVLKYIRSTAELKKLPFYRR